MTKQDKRTQLFGRIFALLLLLSFMDAWIPCRAGSQTAASTPVLKREKIAVMPFLKGRFGTDLSGLLNCPLCQISFDKENLAPDCDKTLTLYLQEALERRHEDMTVPLRQVATAYGQIPLNEEKDTPLSVARELGKRLGADYVFVGTVWRYLDRKGGRAAAETPASVGFALFFIEVSTGALLWNDSFSETQRSLSENIMAAKEFFEMGGRWLTADELALYGVKELMKKFPF
jgi:TolB-like protein